MSVRHLLALVAILSVFAPGTGSAQAADPEIYSVVVDGRKFFITGRDLPRGKLRKVILGEGLELKIVRAPDPTLLVARLPNGVPKPSPGDYRLLVVKNDVSTEYDLTIDYRPPSGLLRKVGFFECRVCCRSNRSRR